MVEVPLTLTCADYARVMPLATGEVKPEGIALTMILGTRGSWPARAEMLRLGTGTVNMPNTHPAAVASSIAMLMSTSGSRACVPSSNDLYSWNAFSNWKPAS